MQKNLTRHLLYAALTAALYVALTFLAAPIAFGPIQCRVSEALAVLPYLLPAAVPGLAVGCLLANLLLGAPLLDIVAGSLATLLAACGTAALGKRGLPAWLAPLPPVLSNALVVGYVAMALYMPELSYALSALYVGLGEALACYLLGFPLLLMLRRHRFFA